MFSRNKIVSVIKNFTDKFADELIGKEVPAIRQEVQSYAINLANRKLPNVNDTLEVYLPKIKQPFQVLLEKVHKLIGARRAKSDSISLNENYQKEEKTLITRKLELEQDLRLLRKDEKTLNNNLKHIMRNWHISLFFLVLLSFAEAILNYKIFLLISTNNATALISAIGVAIALFILSHVFKDTLNHFPNKKMKWVVGFVVIGLVTGLLYGFATLRLSFLSEVDESANSISEWVFVILNLTLFLAGAILVLIYKPNKQTVSDYKAHKMVGDEIKVKSKEVISIDRRLAILTEERNDKLGDLYGILLMAKHYEKIISSEYLSACALFTSENIIARKDSVSNPKAFTETPTPLITYFDDIDALQIK
ncbi:hypothetical protein [Polaribacter cellanae]|uniref:Uncharacterized protein n=1 Tax=Polaribacter cellanae TaxID=2818493 RepID=A0A975CKN5_9FLAO|nr:hypothetical protein [Polaribacter cellanae]QTE21079.1 hypothetical protein J3359_09475 [Polaribacter cellanae]